MCLGIPGLVVSIDNDEHMLATADVAGVRRKISLACIVDDDHPLHACVGDWVLIHVGFAMSRIDEREAQETLRMLDALGETEPEAAAMLNTGV